MTGCKKKCTKLECKAYEMAGRREINKKVKAERHAKRMAKQIAKTDARRRALDLEQMRTFGCIF